MARAGDAGLESTSDDELVEIRANPTRRPPNSLENLLNPQRPLPPAQSVRLRPGLRSEPHLPPIFSIPQQQQQQQQQPQPPQPPQRQPRRQPQSTAVIDLTEEPDSPVETRQSQPPTRIGRNPRRTNSQRLTPPSLSRSDSTFMGPEASVIDLTVDSPEDERASEPRMTRNQGRHQHNVHHHHHHHHHQTRPFGHDQLIELEFINGSTAGTIYQNLARGVRRMVGLVGSDFMSRPFHPNAANFPSSFPARDPSPKPPMEAVPPTRDGFTRDTSSNEERVVICPACNDELAYDPTGNTPHPSSASTGTRKRKRAPGEHHFWALKKCGHVYCADCFENRKPTKSSPEGVGFRAPPGKQLGVGLADVRCAVENCESKAGPKPEWVGIYL